MKFSLCFCAGESQARRLLLSDGVCSLLFFALCLHFAAITDKHKLSGLKQYEFIILQSWRSEGRFGLPG